jgi:hypothetical protein
MTITDIRPADLVTEQDGFTVSVWLVVSDNKGHEVGRTNRNELVPEVIAAAKR